MTAEELKKLIQETVADQLKAQVEAAAKARGLTQAQLEGLDAQERSQAVLMMAA